MFLGDKIRWLSNGRLSVLFVVISLVVRVLLVIEGVKLVFGWLCVRIMVVVCVFKVVVKISLVFIIVLVMLFWEILN